jgi:hypothetical protein
MPLLEAAREAFTQGLHLAAAVSAAAALAFAILVTVLLRQEHAATDQQRS